MQVVYNGQTKTTTANGSGNWSVALTLAEGANTATVSATDAAGNTNTATPSLRLDTVAPTVASRDTRLRNAVHRQLVGRTCANRGGPGICGTAADTNGSGIDDITYELTKSGLLGGNYQCWNGNAGRPASAASSKTWTAARAHGGRRFRRTPCRMDSSCRSRCAWC